MKKIFSFFLAMLFASASLKAQYTLEQIDLSPVGNGAGYNTFPMGINNKGYVCGYYSIPGFTDTTGFVITPAGKIIEITWAMIGAGTVGVKAVSINDDNMVLVNYTDALGESKLHKFLVDDQAIVNSWPITNNLQQSYVKAFHMNNKGDITGWYQGGLNRWMFTLHDIAPPPPFAPWQAWRYHTGVNPNYTYYNTMAGAMDTNRIATGFYIDGLNNKPFLYDEIGTQFYVLNGSNWCHPWGCNNSGKIVGEYKNANSVLNAFVASPTYTPGNPNSGQLNMTSLASIFHSSYYQSVARGINDKDEIVGSYIDTVNGNNYVGFIYRPNMPEYKIYNYDFNKHVWPMANTTGAPGSGNVWTTNFYGGLSYGTNDPFANNGYPLVEPHIVADAAIDKALDALNYNAALPDSACIDWNSFMKEMSGSAFYLNVAQTPGLMPIYRYLHKRNLFLKYVNAYSGDFPGICYGFAGTSSMHLADDSYLDNTYNIGANKNFSTYNDQSKDAISIIQRVFLRQCDVSLAKYYPDKRGDIRLWEGIYRCKRSWMDKDSLNYRQIFIGWFDGYDQDGNMEHAYHSVFPYKIKTPQKLPFFHNNIQNYDTMYVYDSNNPTDQNEYILIKTDKVLNHIDSAYTQYYAYPRFFVAFNEASNSDLMSITTSALKKSRALDSIVRMDISPRCQFFIKDAATQNTAYRDATGYHSTITSIIPFEPKTGKRVRMHRFLRDTIAELQVSTTGYEDSLMSFTFDNEQVQMRLLRESLPGETDNTTIKNRYVSYGNPDNVTKNIIADFTQIDPNLPNGCQITVTGLALPQNDSIITINPANYQYQIIHPSNDTLTYTVNVLAIYNDTVKQFTASGIPFTGPTSHVIDPYYNGAQGPQTIIKIDNGIDAIDDDTLFVMQVPLGLQDGHKNVEFIRLYPNPTRDRFNVQIAKQSAENYQVVFTDMYGKMLLNENVKHQNGTSSYSFDISKYSSGMYFVIVFDKNQKAIFVEKLLKE